MLQRLGAWLEPPDYLAALGENIPMPIDPDLWRDYELFAAFGIKPGEADDMSAVRLDWMLAIHWKVQEVKRRRANG